MHGQDGRIFNFSWFVNIKLAFLGFGSELLMQWRLDSYYTNSSAIANFPDFFCYRKVVENSHHKEIQLRQYKKMCILGQIFLINWLVTTIHKMGFFYQHFSYWVSWTNLNSNDSTNTTTNRLHLKEKGFVFYNQYAGCARKGNVTQIILKKESVCLHINDPKSCL